MHKNHSGFTLVEIAIVLVIIGLLLGTVLKGQELINSAKAKSVAAEFRNTTGMIAAYQDRFRALPGDDKSASAHLASGNAGPTVLNGNGDGRIQGNWNGTQGNADNSGFAHESSYVWQHLRLANLASGAATTPAMGDWEPKNAEGGRIGIQSAPPFATMRGRIFVCQGNLSGRIAQQVDSTMDDGKPDEGSVQFGSELNKVATSVDESSLYIVCASL